MSKPIVLFEKDARNFLEIAPEAMTDASFFIAEWLNDRVKKKKIENILLQSFQFLSEEEFQEVKELSYQRFEQEKERFIQLVQSKIVKLFQISNILNLEGFSIFCLENYEQELYCLIDACLDDCWARQEYYDFLELLQYFMSIEDSRASCLYVCASPGGQYHFFNESLYDITRECLEHIELEFPRHAEEEAETQNDILMDILVLLAPEKIFLYGIKFIENKNFLKTLERIFQPKISFFESVPDFLPHQKM